MARIIISLPDELLAELDNVVSNEHYNRSELIRHAIRELLKEKNEELSQ